MLPSSKKIAIGIVAFIVVGIAVGAVVSLFQTPDFDAIIESEDCGAILGLTEEQLEKATIQQQLSIAGIAVVCAFDP